MLSRAPPTQWAQKYQPFGPLHCNAGKFKESGSENLHGVGASCLALREITTETRVGAFCGLLGRAVGLGRC